MTGIRARRALTATIAVGSMLVVTGCAVGSNLGVNPAAEVKPNTSKDPTGPDAPAAPTVVVTHVVDGDTVYTSDGGKIRLIGYDTPERGECGFDEAKAFVANLVLDESVVLDNPESVDDQDNYDRWLRYVEVGGIDVGQAVIEAGLGHARYDGLDGYSEHPHQNLYRDADAATRNLCE